MSSKTVLLVFFLSAPALADENPQPSFATTANFAMSIDQDASGAAELLRGEVDAAITAAQRSVRIRQDLSAHLTLCVAYIRRNDLDEAQDACDKAVEEASAPVTTARNPYGHKNRDGLAKAYLNRGVLLSLLGQPIAARADFAIALRQNRQAEMVRHNMRLNEASTRTANND